MTQKYTFFLYTPTISPPLTLYCSDEYYPSKPQLEESLNSRHSLPSPYLSLPLHPLVHGSAITFPVLALCQFLFFPYLIFLPLTYVDLILSRYNDFRFSFSCRPIKTRQQQQQRAFSSAFKQPHKMASVLHMASCTKMLQQLLCCSCPGLISRNSVMQQRCEHRHAE